MNIKNLNTLEALEGFVLGNQAVAFSVLGDKHERYQLIQRSLIKYDYSRLPKRDKGIVIQFLMKVTQYSRQQITRLIKQYTKSGYVRWRPARHNGFEKIYTQQEISLLAKMDERHNTPCGHSIKKLCERAYQVFDDTQYQLLSGISVSHIYNLRQSSSYRRYRRTFTKTQSRKSSIGIRRKPQPYGRPGYIRVDTVHQGDLDKKKGVYHINAVDEVTQFEIVCSVEKISEQFLIPVFEEMLAAFPFEVKGFHSDNGSEYINRTVAALLNKLFIEFTKSRSRHCNDNALAESKNASVVRKIFGYQHIAQKWAGQINEFNRRYLNPHINYHRPCFFPEIKEDSKGKQKKHYAYKDMMTPYDKLKSLPDAQRYLKPEVTFDDLDEFAMLMSDNESAELLNQERAKLFNLIFELDVSTA